jgi:hypothetical protein
MDATQKIYPIKIDGHNLKLRFVTEDSPTKLGINMQFVLESDIQDPKEKQDLADKIGITLQKKYGDAGIAVRYNDRSPYTNVISFIVPMQSISKLLVDIIKN